VDLDSGEIYFIREQVGGEYTEFTKIGKVAEKLGRSSLDRAKEHQTGNPRPLVPIEVVQTVFVSEVENTLHREFAPKRILPGEWFILNAAEIATAIARCGELSAANAQLIPLFEQADALATTPSSDEVAPATDDAVAWLRAYRRADYGLKLIDTAKKKLQIFLAEAASRDIDVTEFVDITTDRPRFALDNDLFKQTHPELVAAFTTVAIEFSSKTFRVVPNRGEIFDADGELAEVVAATSELERAIQTSTDDRDEIVRMHTLYFTIIAAQPMLKKQKEIAEAHLKMLCGANAGIEGICNWRRAHEEKTKIDWESIKAAHPAEHSACSAWREPVTKVKIKRGGSGGYEND
jgi:hypothetical protein